MDTSWKWLIHFGDLIKIIDHPRVVLEIMEFLWDIYLPREKRSQIGKEKSDQELFKKIQLSGDFLIVHHLVPEQMLILPIHSFHRKNQLIFRYPGHEKKLLQYIKSKSAKISRNRFGRFHGEPLLRSFSIHYLTKIKKERNDVFIFKKETVFDDPQRFRGRLDSFIAKNPPTYNYPRQHI